VQDNFDDAIKSVKALYDTCLNNGDVKTALQCAKETNKLLRLYTVEQARETENFQSRELAAIREYLTPLNLTDNDDAPTLELVRLATERLQHDDQKRRTIPESETGRRKEKPGKLVRGKKRLPDSPRKKLETKE